MRFGSDEENLQYRRLAKINMAAPLFRMPFFNIRSRINAIAMSTY